MRNVNWGQREGEDRKNTLRFVWLYIYLRPCPLGSGYFWIRNFFFPDTVFVHRYPVNPAYESATFLFCSPESRILNTLWIRNRVDAESGYFLSSDVTRSSPVLYREYCIQDGNLVPRSLKAEQRFSLNFIRLLRGVFLLSVTEGVITNRSNLMKFRLSKISISTQSSSAQVEEGDQELWGTLEQDYLWLVSERNNKSVSDWSIQVSTRAVESAACLAFKRVFP